VVNSQMLKDLKQHNIIKDACNKRSSQNKSREGNNIVQLRGPVCGADKVDAQLG